MERDSSESIKRLTSRTNGQQLRKNWECRGLPWCLPNHAFWANARGRPLQDKTSTLTWTAGYYNVRKWIPDLMENRWRWGVFFKSWHTDALFSFSFRSFSFASHVQNIDIIKWMQKTKTVFTEELLKTKIQDQWAKERQIRLYSTRTGTDAQRP